MEPGVGSRGVAGERCDGGRERGEVGRRDVIGEVGAVSPVDQHLAHEMAEDPMIGRWRRREVVVGHLRRFGAPWVDHPQLSATGAVRSQAHHRIGNRVRVTVRHDGVRADEEQEVRPLLVPHRREPRPAAHQFGDERFARRVDGGRGVLLARTQHAQKSFGGAATVGIECTAAREVHAHGVGTVRVDGGTNDGREVVERTFPRCRFAADLGCVEPSGVVVERPDRPTFRAGVATRQRVRVVAAYANHVVVVVDADDDAAHGIADPTEALDVAHDQSGPCTTAPAVSSAAMSAADLPISVSTAWVCSPSFGAIQRGARGRAVEVGG